MENLIDEELVVEMLDNQKNSSMTLTCSSNPDI